MLRKEQTKRTYPHVKVNVELLEGYTHTQNQCSMVFLLKCWLNKSLKEEQV